MRDTPPTTSADENGLATAIRFQRDLYLYWRMIAQVGGAPLTARQQVARPLLRRLRERLAVGAPDPSHISPALSSNQPLAGEPPDLSEGEDLRLFFIRRLLERLSLLRNADGAGVQALFGATSPTASPDRPIIQLDATGARRTPAARLVAAAPALMARYLAHPLAERLRLCARLWAAGGWWPERQDAQGAPPRLLAPAPPRIAVARRRLLSMLADQEPGEELPVPAHPDGLRDAGRNLGQRAAPGRSRRRLPAAWRSGGQQREVPHASASLTDDEMTVASLYGPLLWMGFSAVGVAPDSEERDEPAGALHAGLAVLALRREFWPEASEHDNEIAAGEAALVERHGRLVAQSNLSLIAYPPLTAPELLTLDTCASEVGLDQTARYQLTRDALAAARASGWVAATVAERLSALIGAPLPANVRVTLDDWERHVARARLTTDVTLLETRDHTLLDALLADPTARGWVARRLTPTAALLTTESLPLVRGWLLRHGRLPAVTILAAPDGFAPRPTV